MSNRYKLATPLWVLTFVYGAALAQQPTPEQVVLPPLPPPIHQPGELPPLQQPTEQQLQRGRELLDKIFYVIANVPLTDATTVLKVFGFTNSHIVTFPTYTAVGPRGKNDDFLQPTEMLGTGFSYIEVQPWVKSPNHEVTARLSATLSPREICISIDDTRRVFGSIAARVNSSRIVDVHPMQKPAPLHGVGYLDFSTLKNPLHREAGITFGFEYQTCAGRFIFSYLQPSNELTK